MSKRNEQLSTKEIELVAQIQADGGQVEERFDRDGNRVFRIIRAGAQKSQINLSGACRIERPDR